MNNVGAADGFSIPYVPRTCQEKKPYNTVQLALNAAWLYLFKHKARLAVYHCSTCKRYHLSRQVDRTTAIACVIP